MRDLESMPALIEAFLRDRSGLDVSVTDYQLMTGGYSRVMAKVACTWHDGRSETLVLRGDPPPEEALLVTDRDLEWAVLSQLTTLEAIPMPPARWYVDDPALFGTKAIFIEHVDSPSLQAQFDAGLDPDSQRDALVDLLASVHTVDVDSLPEQLPRPASWDDYLTGVVAEWGACEDAYVEASPMLRYIGAWLDANRPPPVPLRLVHGDFQAANVLHAADGSYQLVDWEYAHVGDPREDLGWYNGYSSAAPPNVYATDPEGFLARYRDATGFDESQVNQLTVGYFTILGSIKVIAGIYAALGAFARGEANGVLTGFNVLSATYGHMNFLSAIKGIEAAVTAMEAAG
jgi:aminoglycoside phosphotransferase (APT) family kinase protein